MLLLSWMNRAAARVFNLFDGLLLILTLFLLTLNVVMRYFFGYSIIWAEEAARYAFIWIVMLSGAMLTREASHISMEALYNIMPRVCKKSVHIFVDLLTIAVSLLLIKASGSLLGTMFSTNVLSPAAHFPMALTYAVFPVAFVFMITGALEDLVSVWMGDIRDASYNKDLQI